MLNSDAVFLVEVVCSSFESSCPSSQHCATQTVYQSHDCSGLESWRDKDSMGYLWFWGESGGGGGDGGGGGGVGGIFWFTLSWVKVVDRRMGAGDSQGVHGTEATGGATSSCCSWR